MNALSPLFFDDGRVRVIVIHGEPHFVARDVCDQLGYRDANSAVALHCKGPANYHPLPTGGGIQTLRVITEPDLMRLVVASKLPTAERFEKLVFEEILPTIRRTGGYGAPMTSADLNDPELLHELLIRHTAQSVELRRRVEIMEPQVKTLHALARQPGDFSLRDCSKMVGMRPKKFINWLLEIKWLYRSEPGDELRPYQARIDSGHMTLRRGEKQLPGGKTRAISQALVTSKGHIKLGHLLNGG